MQLGNEEEKFKLLQDLELWQDKFKLLRVSEQTIYGNH